jgi:signal transduction histidine kinase
MFNMQYDSGFQTLQSETERILNATTREEICNAVHAAVTTLLDAENTYLYLYNRREESLTTSFTDYTSSTSHMSQQEDTTDAVVTTETVYRSDDSILWDVYTEVDGELLRSIDDINTVTHENTSHDAAIILPLGPYGVLFILEPVGTTFTEIDVSIGEFLAAAVTRALDSERRERGLATVQAVSREAMTANTYSEMGEQILNPLPDALDYPLCAIWRYNSIRHQLEPIATTGPAEELFSNHPVFEPGSSIAWDVFETGSTEVVTDIAAHSQSYNKNSPIKSEVLTSIGDFGVFAAGSTRPGSFNTTEKQIIESLSTNLQTIVRLVDRHSELQLLDDVLGRVIRHNIRNELSIIKGNADILRDTDPNSNDIETFYSEFVDACNRLERTAENAQLMREVVRNRSDAVTVNVETVVKKTVVELQEQHTDSTLTFHCDCNSDCLEIMVHPSFQKGIRELILNAITHTEPDTQPIVDITVTESTDSVTVTIQDNGPGIPKDEHEVLTIESESTLRHGSGAGLWVVERIISYSGGELSFTVNNGTTVEILFPINEYVR